jgi:hypothetical protein
MLEQKAHIRREGTEQRKENSELKHRLGFREKSGTEKRCSPPTASSWYRLSGLLA